MAKILTAYEIYPKQGQIGYYLAKAYNDIVMRCGKSFICSQLYGFKCSYQIKTICKQFCGF